VGVVLTRSEWICFRSVKVCDILIWLWIKRNLIRKSVVCRQLVILFGIIISDRHQHPPSWFISVDHRHRSSSSTSIIISRDHHRRSSSSVTVNEVHRRSLFTSRYYIVSRFIGRWKIVFVVLTFFTSHVYPVGTDFKYFGSGN